ncbi:MAG: tetratricopeptide repeat protein [Kiritimatiellae bacterium]|nr:tetratricopeptide repeat protein [Kiritimatiellia bacterium]
MTEETTDVTPTEAPEAPHIEGAAEPAANAKEQAGELDELMALVNRYGRPIMAGLIVVLVITLGVRVIRHRKQANEQEALAELFRTRATADLQSWVERYPNTQVAPLAQLRLASSQYNEGRYNQAIDTYEAILSTHADHTFAPVAAVGKSHALEASGQIENALSGFEAFLSAQADHFLQPEAVLGKARCLAHQKRYDDARVVCEDLMADKPNSEWSMRAEQTLRQITRMEKGIVPATTPAAPWSFPGSEAGDAPTEVVDIPAITAEPTPIETPVETNNVTKALGETNAPTEN